MITLEELKTTHIFVKAITFHEGWTAHECADCKHKKLKYIKSEPWTSIYECTNCNISMYVVSADRMGGNWSETVEIYKPK
jgi:ribosomal protein L37AE/L43A